MNQQMTIREAYLQASSFLEKTDSEQDARQVARLLLEYLLGWDRSRLLLHWDDPFPQEKLETWQDALNRKAKGEPVQYITGEQEFYGLSFHVTPAVLIPRPETELLVEAVLNWGQRIGEQEGRERLTVADIGTGSGILSVTLAWHRPNWQLSAVDLSAEALHIAQGNAVNHGVAERIEFLQGDLLQPLVKRQLYLDILVSNPPYIPTFELADLQTEVIGFEPRLALDGGKDGLDCYRRMIYQLKQLPRLPKIIAFEVGQGQAEDVGRMIQEVYPHVEYIKDFAGIARHVMGIGEMGYVK